MRIQRARINQILFNKVNGKKYRVVEKEDMVAVAHGIDPKTMEIVEEEPIYINEDNDICFRIVDDPNAPEDPQGFTVEDGRLLYYGNPIIQGDYIFDKIISTVPCYLLLAGKRRNDEEDHYRLISYHIYNDTFKEIFIQDTDKICVIGKINDGKYNTRSVIMGWSSVHEESKVINGITKTVTVHDGTMILWFYRGRMNICNLPYPVLFNDEKYLITLKNGEHSLFVKSIWDSNEDGELVSDFVKYARIDMNPYEMVFTNSIITREDIQSVTTCYLKDEPFIRTAERILYDGFSVTDSRIRELEGYDYLVDFSFEQSSVIFTLANEKYDVVHVKGTMTTDRGIVVTFY